MKKITLFVTFILLLCGIVFSYREFNQLNYTNEFRIKETNKEKEFIVYPDSTINSNMFKIHIKGHIEGSANITALTVYRSKKGSSNSSNIINLNLSDEHNIDTTLRVPYYGRVPGDKVILIYKPESVQQVDFMVRAGSFGLPFEKMLSHLL